MAEDTTFVAFQRQHPCSGVARYKFQMDKRERLAHAMAHAGVSTAADLARRTHLSEVSVRAYVAGERNPPLHKCESIGKALGFHGRWLFDGTGPKKLSDIQSVADEKPTREVPLLDDVTAGKLRSPSSQIPLEQVPLVTVGDLDPGDYFALRVSGNSMDRLSPEGSIIIVDLRDRRLVSGRAYVFDVRGETTYKLWQGGDPPYLDPFSTDPTHKPVFVKRKRDLEVIGRVRRTMLDL
ncbi:LexA family transcriptional regulator [Methylobacterium komagatae]